jgi:hypothetical protein
MDKKLFYEELTYEEWVALQDKNSLEFRALEACHNTHPGYDLEEIKNFIYINVIETENNQKLCLESFSARHINSQKLNEQMSKLCRAIFSANNEYKSVDKRGHGDSVSIRFGGRNKEAENITFRIEEKAIRYAHYLIEHNLVGEPTVTDLVRKGFSKYMEMLPTINEVRDAVTNRFVIDIQIERENLERVRVTEMLKGFENRLIIEEEDLTQALRHIDNKDELIEIRDWTTKFIKDALSYNGPTKKEMARIREFIMGNPRLYNILSIFERQGLIKREYIDDVRQKGIAPTFVDVLPNDDIKYQGEH